MDTCEEKRRMTIANLKKWGYLSPGAHQGGVRWSDEDGESSVGFLSYMDGDGYGRLNMSYWATPFGQKKELMEYVILITITSCNYGGKRQWFLCPLYHNGIPCQRRVGRLYMSGKYFGCRQCHGLTYESQYRRRGGFGGLCEVVFGHDEIVNQERKLRIKFWHGRPTKRYRTLLKRMNADYKAVRQLNRQLEELRKKYK